MKKLKSIAILLSLGLSIATIGVVALTPRPHQPTIVEIDSEPEMVTVAPAPPFIEVFNGKRVFDGVTLEENEMLTTYTAPYISVISREEDLKSLQCPIPMECRVKNYTGIQCVWSSIEMLGRWAEEPKLTNPPITSRADCKSYSSPSLASRRLDQLKVKFEQVPNNKERGRALIKKAMAEHRGCLWGVPGHAMVIIHYSEEQNKVCWVDNSDRTLRVQTTDMKGFERRWQGWILVIYADKDIIPEKMDERPLVHKIPIIDRNNPQGNHPKDYIPIPKKD